jgi:serine/threonine protein phosphatase 1
MYNFHEEVRHIHINHKIWSNIYVIGDVHGCKKELEHLLERCSITRNDLVLFVGDLIRKGPNSDSVVDIVRESDNMFSVMGNNEWKVANLDEYSSALEKNQNKDWISELPHIITVDSTAVVHGGFDNGIPIKNHKPNEIMNMRSLDGDEYQGEQWYESYSGELRVFAGHTVHNKPYVDRNGGCIDTGCVYGMQLTAIRLEDDRIFQVESEKGLHRDEESIVYMNSTS